MKWKEGTLDRRGWNHFTPRRYDSHLLSQWVALTDNVYNQPI